MIPSGHLEIVGAEPEAMRPAATEMVTDTINLSSSAANLAPLWLGCRGKWSSDLFTTAARSCFVPFKPLLRALRDSACKNRFRRFPFAPRKHSPHSGRTRRELPNFQASAQASPGPHSRRQQSFRESRRLQRTIWRAPLTNLLRGASPIISRDFRTLRVLDMAELWMLIPALKLGSA